MVAAAGAKLWWCDTGSTLACDKMCEVSKMYRLDSGSVTLTDDVTHFGIDVRPF